MWDEGARIGPPPARRAVPRLGLPRKVWTRGVRGDRPADPTRHICTRRNRHFRMEGSCKGGKTAVLQPLHSDEALPETVFMRALVGQVQGPVSLLQARGPSWCGGSVSAPALRAGLEERVGVFEV